MKKILYTGTTGLLGTYITTSVPSGVELHATIHRTLQVPDRAKAIYHRLDIRDADAVEQLIATVRPDVVLHAAAHGIVEFCEQHQEEAIKTNVTGTKNLLSALQKHGGRLVFYSTNATFDGFHAPYKEDDEQLPANFYGKTKVMSEQDIKNSTVPYTIIRLITMYGWNNPQERKNPVSWGIETLQKGEPIHMVTDVWNNFLHAKSAALGSWAVALDDDTAGKIFHFAGATKLNRYELMTQVATAFGLNPGLVNAVTSDFFPSHVQRAPDTTFDITRFEKDLGQHPWSIQEGLTDMKQNLILPSDFRSLSADEIV